MVTIKQNIAKKENYGNTRKTIKYIVIHYTANDGDTDESNGKYFHNNIVKASSHYFVDSDSITQSVPDDYTAWAVGGKVSTTNGAGRLYGKCTNANSISIELCDDQKNGVIYPSEATIQNAVDLVKMLMGKYNIPLSNVIRHYDVNGKKCPAYWVDDAKWQSEFLARFGSAEAKDSASYYPKYTGSSSSIVSVLKAIGETDTSFTNRKKIAVANGIDGYTGTASQNLQLVSLAKSGKLKKA